jgi:hypothetical protein
MKGDDALLSKPESKAGRLQRVCLDLLHEHESDGAIPTSARFLFYELSAKMKEKQNAEELDRCRGGVFAPRALCGSP